MGRGQWLDPVTRQLLRLTEQLPSQKRSSRKLDEGNSSSKEIEKELHELKLKQEGEIRIPPLLWI